MSRFSVQRAQRLLVVGPMALLLLNCCAGALANKLGNSTIRCWSNSMKFLSVFVLSLVVLTLNVAAVGEDKTPQHKTGVSSLSSRATDVNSVPSLLDLQTPKPPF